jgi:hypothetical protein
MIIVTCPCMICLIDRYLRAWEVVERECLWSWHSRLADRQMHGPASGKGSCTFVETGYDRAEAHHGPWMTHAWYRDRGHGCPELQIFQNSLAGRDGRLIDVFPWRLNASMRWEEIGRWSWLCDCLHVWMDYHLWQLQECAASDWSAECNSSFFFWNKECNSSEQSSTLEVAETTLEESSIMMHGFWTFDVWVAWIVLPNKQVSSNPHKVLSKKMKLTKICVWEWKKARREECGRSWALLLEWLVWFLLLLLLLLFFGSTRVKWKEDCLLIERLLFVHTFSFVAFGLKIWLSLTHGW